jgi:hypothetical protein
LDNTNTRSSRNTDDRAAAGGLVVAGGDSRVATVAGGAVVDPALVSGAIGVVGDAVNSPRDVELGTPGWR